MSFNLTYLTRVSVLTLSALTLSVLGGCSNSGDYKGGSQSAKAEQSNSADPFDNYYGAPKSGPNDGYSGPKLAFKANAPTRYVVKKGDTLWGISNMFLKNPAYWPEVWDKNQKVKNPHLIFPGDVLFIYQGGNGSQKLIPQMRVIRKGGGEPISTLLPFLSWPRVLDDDTINNAPYIVAAEESNLLLEKNNTVYVRNLKDRQVGGEYAIFNPGKIISDPKTGQNYGREVIYNGFLEVKRPSVDAEVATARVVESIREIRKGDKLLFIEDETHNLKTPISIPKTKIRADVISLFDADMISAQTQIITINKGSRQGMKLGYTLGVYSPGKLVDDPIKRTEGKYKFSPTEAVKVAIPPAYAATAIVYKVLNDISYALITESVVEVKNGYKIGNP